MAVHSWKADGLEGLARGSRVWCAAGGGDGAWRLGTLQSLGATECRVALDSEALGEGAGEVVAAPAAAVVPANPELLDQVDDLTALSFLNNPSILHALRRRYGADGIYTHAGPVLIAVNPFKPLHALYSPEHVDHYRGRSNLEVTEGYAPHVFLTADKAFKQASGRRVQRAAGLKEGWDEDGAEGRSTRLAARVKAGAWGDGGGKAERARTNSGAATGHSLWFRCGGA